MTSYLRYQKEIRTVQDADDIESWITVRGNHIPIKKGQSKEEAVKSFLKNKGGSSKTERKLSNGGSTVGLTQKEHNKIEKHNEKVGKIAAQYKAEGKKASEFIEKLEKKDPAAVKKFVESVEKTWGKNSKEAQKAREKYGIKEESSKKWSGAWSKRANKPETLGEAAKKATEISKKQAEKNFKPKEIPANKLKKGDIVKHDGELYRVYEKGKGQVRLEAKNHTLLIHSDDKTGKYVTVSPQQREKLNKILNGLNSKEEENYKKWTEKKPEFNTKKLLEGDLEEFAKFSAWEKSAGAMKYEKKQDTIHKIFGSSKKYWIALHNNEVARKERAKTNKNYLDDDVGMGLLEIAYNDVSFSNKASSNRSALLKAIKESEHESSKEMTELIKNIPDEKIKNIGAFIRYLEAATEGKK